VIGILAAHGPQRLDLDERFGFPDGVEVLESITGRVTGVIPAFERCDDDRVAQIGQVGSLRTAEIRGGHRASVSPAWGG